MRAIDHPQFLALLNFSKGTFDSKQHRVEMAFAFGDARRAPGSELLDLDIPFHLAVEELTPSLTTSTRDP